MKRKLIKMAFVIAIAMLGGINVFNAQKSESLSDIVLANVEALADTESLMIGCDLSSIITECERICFGCFTEYKAINGYGYSTGIKGTCKCGRSY